MDPYRQHSRTESDRRNRRGRDEDRWSRRGDYERDPIDPFEGQEEQEEWRFSEREQRRFDERRFEQQPSRGRGQQSRYDRGFEDLEDWQQPRQFGRSWDEGYRGQQSQGGQGYSQSGQRFDEPYGRQGFGQGYTGSQGSGGGQSYGQERQSYGMEPYGSERFGTRQPYGSGQSRGEWESEGFGRSQRFGGSQRFGQEREGGEFAGKGPKGYRRADERIREDLCDRFTADPHLDASEISVTVQQGEVTLEGTVSERNMKRAAEDLAEEISGVREVNNRLRVQRREGGDGGGDSGRSKTSQSTSSQSSPSQTSTSKH